MKSEIELKWEAFDQSFKVPKNDFPDVALWGHSRFWEVAGNGPVTNPDNDDPKGCGRYYGTHGCLDVQHHAKTTFNEAGVAVDHTGKMFGHKRFRWCHSARCPICFKWGYAAREAREMERRLGESSKKNGKVQHVVVSAKTVPEEQFDFYKEYDRVNAAARKRGITGGYWIFHPFRYHRADETFMGELPHWFWSPHWHLFCHIAGGYACRGCPNLRRDGESEVCSREKCMLCGKFEAKNRLCNERDGFVFKVKGERESVFWSCWYALNHAGIRSDDAHWHIPRPFGVCSYRKLKLSPREKYERSCPICGNTLKPIKYVGRGQSQSVGEFWIQDFEELLLDDDGLETWIYRVTSGYG
jgi:hypothetical protein